MPNRKVFQMKIIQSGWNNQIQGRPYRIIEIPDDCTLHEFASIITTLFDFDFDHAFGFYSDIKNYYQSPESYELFADMGEETNSKGVKKTIIKNVFKESKKKWLFLFDYGDEWHFILEKIKNVEYDPKEEYYKLIISVGEPIPQYPDFNEDE
jgi:pRiA4b ORF-3-like protein